MHVKYYNCRFQQYNQIQTTCGMRSTDKSHSKCSSQTKDLQGYDYTHNDLMEGLTN